MNLAIETENERRRGAMLMGEDTVMPESAAVRRIPIGLNEYKGLI